MRIKKWPAHTVILEWLRASLKRHSKVKDTSDGGLVNVTKISTFLGILRKMAIPKEHRSEVAAALRVLPKIFPEECEGFPFRETIRSIGRKTYDDVRRS